MVSLEERLERIEAMIAMLLQRQQVRDWYSTGQVAQLLGKCEYTVRQWCRMGRVNAAKKSSGRGAHLAWTISNDELLRVQRDGLLPVGGLTEPSDAGV